MPDVSADQKVDLRKDQTSNKRTAASYASKMRNAVLS